MIDPSYLNKIQQLIELQKIDDEIFEVKSLAENAPREVASLQEKFSEVELHRTQILDKLDHLEEQKKRVMNEMEEDSSRIKKSRNKLMQVANPREYQAMLREMDSMEKMSRNREEEKLALLETLQLRTNELNDIDKEYTSLKNELTSKRDRLDETLREASEKLAVLAKKREAASSQIPEKVLQRYEFIRKRLDHPVIVDVEDGVCSGCNIAVPPQVFIDLQSSEQILNCPNCQRIVFWSEHFQLPNRQKRPKRNEMIDEMDDEDEIRLEQEMEDQGADIQETE